MSGVEEYQPEAQNFKPGQKHATPSPGFGDRVFYETLLQQRPDSEMAQDWCLAYGILDTAQAQELYEKVLRRKGKVGSPVKKAQPPAKGRVSTSSSSRGGIAETKASHLVDSDMDEKSEAAEEEEEDEERPVKSKKASTKSAAAGKKRRRSGGKNDDSDEEEDNDDEEEEEEFDG